METQPHESLLSEQNTPPLFRRALWLPITRVPVASVHDSAGGSSGASPYLRDNNSGQSPVSGSSESVSSRSSYCPSQNTTSSAPSISPNHRNINTIAGDRNINTIAEGRRQLPCTFPYCNASFDIGNRDNWYRHHELHFFDYGPPMESLCIFCDKAFLGITPKKSWAQRMQHIGDHFEAGLNFNQTRPDFTLYKYLWLCGLLPDVNYQHIILYTERPQVCDVRPYDYVPNQIQKRRNRDYNVENRIVVKESRNEIRRARTQRVQIKQKRVLKAHGKKHSNIVTQSVPESIETYNISIPTIQNQSLGQKGPESASLCTSMAPEETRVSIRNRETEHLANSTEISHENLYDSESDNSPSSQDETVIGTRPSYNGFTSSCIHLDYDSDEDLMSPENYKQKLKDIQNDILKNSLAELLENHSQSSGYIILPHIKKFSDPALSSTNMLKRLKQNIRTLQMNGLCKEKISFLTADPDRKGVASLVCIPISQILNLVPSDLAENIEERCTPKPRRSASLIANQSTEGMNMSPWSNEYSIINNRTLINTSSYNQSSIITPLSSDLTATKRNRASSTLSKYSNSSLRATSLVCHKCLLRVPDPPPGAHGITAYHRGAVTVINHMLRCDCKSEPRVSDCRSCDFKKGRPRKPVTTNDEEKSITRFRDFLCEDSWIKVLEGCITILQTLQIRLSIEDQAHIVYTTLWVLDFIILSYSRAHISPPKKSVNEASSLRSFWKISGTQIQSSCKPCLPQIGAITLARRSLRCLNGFLDNNQVWVFHGEQIDPRETQPLFLSTSPEDFADIWGPMWKMTDSGKSESILRYDLENGSIIPMKQNEGTRHFMVNLLDNEEFCHWISDNELRRIEALSEFAIISKPRLLIGAKKKIKIEENRDCHCDASCITREFRNNCLLQPVGTRKPRRRVDAEAVNGSLGGGIAGVQVTYSMVTKVEPGRTFKESLLKRWSHDQQRRNPHVLSKYAAVEMSFCTHNSRRIRLVDLLGTDTILRLLDVTSPIKDQKCNDTVREILGSDPARLIDLYIDNPEWREEIANLVSTCLETLCDTGIKQEMTEPVSAFWMYHNEEYIVTLPRSLHRWSGLILDSMQSCTFLVLVEKCLVVEVGRGCQYASKTGKGRMLNECDPLLESALVVNERMDRPVGLKLIKKGKTRNGTCWDVSKLERGSLFKMGECGGLEVIEPLSRTRLLVRWVPRNSFKAGFQEFMSRIVEKDPELHHIEYDGEVITGDPLPISIFVT